MDNPFADLVPQQAPQQAPQMQGGGNPFDDLVPHQVPQSMPQNVQAAAAAPPQLSPFMSGVVGFNKGVGDLAQGALQPLAESGLLGKRVSDASKAVAAKRAADYQAAVDANPLYAMGGQFVGSVAPAMVMPGMGAEGVAAKFGKAALLNGGLGLSQYTNNDNRLMNGVLGAIGGTIGSGVGQLGDLGVQAGAKLYAQTAIPGLVQRATNSIKNYITPEQAAKTFQGNYLAAATKNNENWNQVNSLAGKLDGQLTANLPKFNPVSYGQALDDFLNQATSTQLAQFKANPTQTLTDFLSKTSGAPATSPAFDASPFTKTIKGFLGNIKQMEPAVSAQYDQAKGFANYIKQQAPQSFSGTVALRQNLNQELKNYLEANNMTVSDAQTTGLINKIKSSLQATVSANKDKVDPASLNDFNTSWRTANKSHEDLQDFYKSPNPEGLLKPTRYRQAALESNNPADRAIIGKYLKPSLGGTTGINQLNKLTGSDNAARSYVMRNVTEGRGSQTALDRYEALSQPQRQALFQGLPEGDALQAASVAKNTLGQGAQNTKGGSNFMHHLGALGTPGLAAFLGAKTLGGQDWDTSLAYGLGASALAHGGQSAVARLASPASALRATNRAITSNPNAGRYLSPVLASLFAREVQQ